MLNEESGFVIVFVIVIVTLLIAALAFFIDFFTARLTITSQGHAKEVDWWSLGILLFEMLVGGPPFYHENVQIMYRMIEEEDVPMPEKYLPPTGRDLLSKLLNRNPTQRLGYGAWARPVV